jgi:preprotein translocase subunit SecE
MAMNREQKRLLQRQGYLGEDGEAVQPRRERAQQALRPDRQRTSPKQFLKEMRAELRKVVWPTKQELLHYSFVVLVFLVVITTMVALVDWGFAKGVLWLFGVK